MTMTTPTKEAAEIVARKLGGTWTADNVLNYYHSDHAIPLFARYVTEETEVTDAMVEAGKLSLFYTAKLTPSEQVREMHRAMIAAKHKGLLPEKVEVEDDDPIDALVDLLAPVLRHGQGMAASERENRFRNAMQALIAKTREVHELRAKLGEG